MPTLRPIFNDFSAGELSPRLAGRVDLPVYYRGARELTNFQVQLLGGVSKRYGTEYVLGTNSGNKSRIIPFTIDDDTVILMELTASHIRMIDVATGGVLSLSGTPIDIPTSYTEAELFEVKYAQTNRECYFVHRNHAPVWVRYKSGTSTSAVIEYTSADTSFAGNLIAWTAPTETPWQGYEMWEEVAQWLSVRKEYTATGTFNSKTVTKVMRTDLALTVTFSDLTTLDLARASSYSYAGSINIDLRPFIGAGNYPGAACFFAGRLWLGGSINDPAVIWASKPWDYKNFVVFEELVYEKMVQTEINETGSGYSASATANNAVLSSVAPALTVNELAGKYATGVNVAYGSQVVSNTANTVTLNKNAIGTSSFSVRFTAWKDAMVPEYEETTETTQQIGAGSAIRITLATEEDERIMWIAGGQDLYVGTSSSEWVIAGSSNAVSARAVITSRYGSAEIQARMVGGGIYHVSQASRHIRQMGQGTTATMQAEHMVRPGVVQLDYQQTPDLCLWAVIKDGTAVRCLMDSGAGIMAWDRIQLQDGDIIESVAVVPWGDGDKVYLTVDRPIGATHYRFIERLSEYGYLDSSKSGSGTTLSLPHLEGRIVTVRYKAGGVWYTVLRTVTSGTITIPSATEAVAGIPFPSVLETHFVTSADSEGLTKGIGRVFFRLYESDGFTVRHEDGGPPAYVEVEGYTGSVNISTDIPFGMDVSLRVESDDPVPVNIQSIVPEAEVGG